MSEDGPSNKRPRSSSEAGAANFQAGDPEYLMQLEAEREKLQTSESELPHSLRLVLAEIERVKTGGSDNEKTGTVPAKPSGAVMPWERPDDGTGIRAISLPDQTVAGGTKSSMKIFVPTTSIDARKGSSRGLLLGTGGNTLRALQTESKCKLTIKGKGSVKNAQEAAPGTDTEEEDLHVLVEYDGPANSRDQVFCYVDKMIRTILAGGVMAPMASPYTPYGGYGVPSSAANYESEQAYVNSQVAAGQIVAIPAGHWENGLTCKSAIKVYVPAKTAVGDSRGKILGTKGSSLRQIQNECGCKLSLRGRGSLKIPDGETEDSMATSNPTQHGHLKDPLLLCAASVSLSGPREGLHVVVEFEGPPMRRDAAFQVMMQQKQTPYPAQHMYPGMDAYGQPSYRPPPPAPVPPPQWGQPYGAPPPAAYPGYAGYY